MYVLCTELLRKLNKYLSARYWSHSRGVNYNICFNSVCIVSDHGIPFVPTL